MSNRTVFVFATNETGHHENEMAQFAVARYGAKKSVGKGMAGDSYAIPVLNRDGGYFSQQRIVSEIREFKEFAAAHPDWEFRLSRIGCDQIGFADDNIHRQFTEVPANVRLPGRWRRMMDPRYAVLAIVGSTEFSEAGVIIPPLQLAIDFQLGADAVCEYLTTDDAGVDFVVAQHLAAAAKPLRVVGTDWDVYGKRAGAIRNRDIGLDATHLILFDDGYCGKCAHMRKTAKAEGLITISEARVTYLAPQASANPAKTGEAIGSLRKIIAPGLKP